MKSNRAKFSRMRFGVTEHTPRFYTDKGLLPCQRDGGNRRVFDEESVNWMQGIQCLKGCGASIEACRRLEEAKATVNYMEDKAAHYEAILAGLSPDDTNPRNWTVESRPRH